MSDLRAYDVKEAAEVVSMSPDILKRAIRQTKDFDEETGRHRLKAKKNGQRYSIRSDDLWTWWESLPDA